MTETWCFACYGAGYIKVSDINIVCPTCRGQGTLNKGEIQMSEENNQEVTTPSPLDAVQQEITKLKEALEQSQNDFRAKINQVNQIRESVHQFFTDAFDSSYDDATINLTDVNELLSSIGASQLEQEFEGRVTITYSFTVKAEDEDDARAKVEEAVGNLENQIDAGNDDSYSEESIEVEF
jgi:uncharacterized Zn finger protein (UPF0148 family)